MEKYALLDTDFISKTHTVRIDDNDHLIDRILEMPEYVFFCHEQTVVELSRHNSYAPEWLKKKIEEKIILCYTDEQIKQTLVRVVEATEVKRMQRITCEQALYDIFADKFIKLKNGLLKYKE